jgi:hypothetical protein
MPNLFTSNTITRLSQEGENAFAVMYPCIIKRIAPAIVSGQNLITIPDDVKSIQRVAYKGYKLDPLPQRNFREVFQNGGQQGKPFWYIFNNVGQNTLQLFPTPSENIAAATDNLFGSAIINQFIITYYAVPDYATYIIPDFFRRRLLKNYVLRGCFNIEGQGQNLKASKYFKQRWEQLSQLYGNLLCDLHNKPRKLVVNGITSAYYFPGQPILPIDRFGISVNTGE